MTSALTAAIRLARLAETRSVVETREDILETRLSEGESQTAASCEVAGRQGFEPRYRGPEPRVLPLDDLPIWDYRVGLRLLGASLRRSNETPIIHMLV
jgi:hypothetical protein